MATEFEREILDVLTSIRHGCSLDEAGLLLQQNGKRHLRSAEQMCWLFHGVPEAIATTGELSDRLAFQMKDIGYEFPRYPILEGESMDSFLRKRACEGVARRYGAKTSARLRARANKQVERELALIAKPGLAGYFLIVWDVVEFCRKHGIVVQGRGSAANSAVCYSLGITTVDPVGMELLFERFLSEVGGEWPDIDLDLPSGDDRERAIQYVYTRYGQLGAAMCANVITYRGRSAAREVCKALGFDAETQTKLTRLVGSWEWKGPKDTMEAGFQEAGFDLRHPRIAKYLELSIRMLDLPRHLGQHSGGMIIAEGQLASVVPIEPASMPGRNVVQWDKEDCADMGLIKVDLLGLGMMAVLKDCVDLIPRYYGETVDIAQIPHDDPRVYESLRRLSGEPVVHLVASTSGTDADWVVKLINVQPDRVAPPTEMSGYELPLATDIFRGRYRSSFEHPEPIKPNEPLPYVFGLPMVNHTFDKGHRIMVQLQSTLFPLYDRNPQKYVPNIFLAKPEDYGKATERIWHEGGNASFISLPVVPVADPSKKEAQAR